MKRPSAVGRAWRRPAAPAGPPPPAWYMYSGDDMSAVILVVFVK